ncbi:hypothetical protein ABT024_17005 [Streptomyces sp. NPDC002812]|uniref:hypothetical protein n=1 Tax=Streptomyces sp. NPDC002812 TaxID=3154434 RepID=UPI0033348DC4
MSVQSPSANRADERGVTAPARESGGVVSIAVFFLFFILGLMLHSALATTTYPAPDDAADLLLEWRRDNGDVSRLSGAALSISALVFTWFCSWFASVIHRTGRTQAAFVVFAGGLFSALGLFLSGVLQWVAQRPETLAEMPVLRVVHQITFVLGGPLVVTSLAPIVAVGGIALVRAGLLQKWLGYVGVALGVICLGSVVMLIPEDGSLTFLVPIGRFLSLLWLTVVAVVLTGRIGRARA